MSKNKPVIKETPPIANPTPILDVDAIKLKVVYFTKPTTINFKLLDKVSVNEFGTILLHTHYVSFQNYLVPLSNVSSMEIE